MVTVTATAMSMGVPRSVRLFNRVGKYLEWPARPLTTLDEDTLLRRARRRTRLSDFGTDEFLEPMRVILDSAKKDAALTFLGRLLAHAVMVETLSNRLRIQRELTDHPEILELPVRRPLIVVGPPRTGTTLLHHLLAADPAARYLRAWEGHYPAPLSRWTVFGRDRRVLRSRVTSWMLRRMVPALSALHAFGHDAPEECHTLTRHTFVGAHGMMVQTYREWFRAQPEELLDTMYAEYRRVLQVLHHQHPADDHWVLKSPVHLWGLASLMRAVPEATIVLTHRHMREVIPSFCSLLAVAAGACTNAIEPVLMGPRAIEIGRAAVRRMGDARAQFDSARIVDMPYEELVADPVAAVRRILDHGGYAFTPAHEEKLAAHLAKDKRDKDPKHAYTLAQFGLDKAMVNEAFADYHQQYGLA